MKFKRRRPPIITTIVIILGCLALFWGVDELPSSLTSLYAPFFTIIGALATIIILLMWVSHGARSRWMKRQQSLAHLKNMTWREFEHFVAEAYRFDGWVVLEQQASGKDGGIDLILKKKGKPVLVQCKHWASKIGVKTVREMYGLMHHHQAQGVKIVGLCGFTNDAQTFSQGKPIELVTGDQLLAYKNSHQALPPLPDKTICSKCGSDMIKKQNRQNKKFFWGCTSYPSCTHTRRDLS